MFEEIQLNASFLLDIQIFRSSGNVLQKTHEYRHKIKMKEELTIREKLS